MLWSMWSGRICNLISWVQRVLPSTGIHRGVGVGNCFRFPWNFDRTLPTDAFHFLIQPAEGALCFSPCGPLLAVLKGEPKGNKKAIISSEEYFFNTSKKCELRPRLEVVKKMIQRIFLKAVFFFFKPKK